MQKDKILDRAKELLDDITINYDGDKYPEEFIATRAAIISFLSKIYHENHPFLKEIISLNRPTARGSTIIEKIMEQVIKELEQGFLDDIKFTISAEIFTDFVDMAEHLLDTGYKDAAAVILGSSLESHLRKVANKYKISTTFKNKKGKIENHPASKLNDELHKAQKYNAAMHKSIMGWIQIRNDAAHGKFTGFNEKQVSLMLDGIRHIISSIN